MKPTEQEVSFVGSQGAKLSGRLHKPAEKAKGSVLMAHCFTCSKDIHTMTRLANGLAHAGYAAFRFDFTGRGDSGGDFEAKTLSANVSDVTRAAATLIQMNYGPCAVLGHSLGGAAVLQAASKLKTVRSVITIGAPSDARHVSHLFSGQVDELRERGRAEVTIGGRTFWLQKQFLDDLDEHNVLACTAELDRRYLIVHARDDDVVEFANAEALYEAAGEKAELLALEVGGHLLANRGVAEQVLNAIVQFLDSDV